MANAAFEALGEAIIDGVVITKYDHSRGPIGNLQIFEAGHPVPDENSYRATRAAMELVKPLGKDDTVLFLVSGGGSALFECPLIPEDEMADVTKQLLACGADIVEMNTIRKRLSGVKGGRVRGARESREGLCHCALRYSGRSTRYDRLWPCVSGQLNVRGCDADRGEIRPAPVG